MALQGVRDTYSGLFGDHAAIMIHLMRQHDTREVAQYIKFVWTHMVILALRARHQISLGGWKWCDLSFLDSCWLVHCQWEG